MKIALTGKGGVGKTTVSALLAEKASSLGQDVMAVDGDPDSNLGDSLGIKGDITPVAEMEDLIEERTGGSGLVKLNPAVEDIPERFYRKAGDIKVLMMGRVSKGGSGCKCPENAFLRELLSHLLLDRKETVICDMEAGVEHMGRGTVKGLDALVVVVEPDVRSIKTMTKIESLAEDIQVEKVYVVGNKIRNSEEKDFIKEKTEDRPLALLPYSEEIRKTGLNSGRVPTNLDSLDRGIEKIWKKLKDSLR